jgi:SAM-dependent methyltransferase
VSDKQDGWVAGATYEDFMGRWSRRLAPEFVSWLQIPGEAHWLDVGCGTGALTDAICDHAEPASVAGCDPAAAFIEYASEHSEDNRASFVVAGAGSLPSHVGGYGSVTSLLALNFFPDPEAAVREMRSVTAPEGTVSACVWDYAGQMEFLRRFWDVAVAEDSRAREFDEGVRFPICRLEALANLFNGANLADVSCEAIVIPTEFASFDDYWTPLLAGTGPAAAYVTSLDADRRAALARNLEQSLPRGRDGAILLSARAWAVRGIAT